MGYRFLRASFALLTTIYRLTTKGRRPSAAFPDLSFTLIKTRRIRKNTRKDADGWIQQSAAEVFYRESKPFSSRAQGLFIVSVNLFYREKNEKNNTSAINNQAGEGFSHNFQRRFAREKHGRWRYGKLNCGRYGPLRGYEG